MANNSLKPIALTAVAAFTERYTGQILFEEKSRE